MTATVIVTMKVVLGVTVTAAVTAAMAETRSPKVLSNNIYKFEGCFLRGKISSKGFKQFQRLHKLILNLIGPFAKKMNMFCFQKTL